MPRIARGCLERGTFHVLNRGNHRQPLFRCHDDFAVFLDLLACSVAKFEVKLYGYCLMGNHWHLVTEVATVAELSRWIHWLCNRHVRQFHSDNHALGGGHLYQGRYKSFPVQDKGYLYRVLRYVEANPLRARLVASAQDWPWSSLSNAPVRRGLVEVIRPKLAAWNRDESWLQTVNRPLPLAQLDVLRQSVVRGTPQGDAEWVTALVKQAGMEATIRPRGRPAKITDAAPAW